MCRGWVKAKLKIDVGSLALTGMSMSQTQECLSHKHKSTCTAQRLRPRDWTDIVHKVDVFLRLRNGCHG